MAEDLLNLNETPQVDPALLAEAQNAVNSLTTTAKVFRTYPRENTISITAIDNMARAFSDYLVKHQSLELFVNRHELHFHEVAVYSETDPRRSFALKLDRDGVRRILFSEGVSREELVGLLEALTTDVSEESLDDDVVTLLWDKQLQHVKVFVFDDTAQQGESGFNSGLIDSGDQNGQDKHAESRVPANRSSSSPGESAEKGVDPDHSGQSEVCESTRAKLQPVSGAQDEFLTALSKAEETRDASGDLTDILFEILQIEAESDIHANACKVLVEMVMMHARDARFAAAGDLAARMRTMAANEAIPAESRKRLQQQLMLLAESSHIAVVIETMKAHENLNASDLARFFSEMPPESAFDLCELLTIERYDQLMRTVIKDMVSQNPSVLVPKLSGGDPDAAKKVLDIMSTLTSPELMKDLLGPLAAADDSLKMASVKLAESVKCPASRELLLGYATSTNAGLRRGALRALAGFPAEGTPLAILRSEARARDFDERALDEKRVFFSAIARLEGRTALPFLDDIVSRRPWFERQIHAETRACAALAFGEIGEAAASLIEKHAADKSQAVAMAVRIASGKMRPVAAMALGS